MTAFSLKALFGIRFSTLTVVKMAAVFWPDLPFKMVTPVAMVLESDAITPRRELLNVC